MWYFHLCADDYLNFISEDESVVFYSFGGKIRFNNPCFLTITLINVFRTLSIPENTWVGLESLGSTTALYMTDGSHLDWSPFVDGAADGMMGTMNVDSLFVRFRQSNLEAFNEVCQTTAAGSSSHTLVQWMSMHILKQATVAYVLGSFAEGLCRLLGVGLPNL